MFNFTRCNFLKFKSTEKGAGKKGWVIKHKWERPFRVVPISSLLNFFIRGVRLRLCGWLYFHLLHACAFCRFIIQPIAFGLCLLQHHLPAVLSVVPYGKPSGTECITEYRVEHHLRSELLLYGTLGAFQLSCSLKYLKKLASPFSSGLNSTF